MLELWRPCYSFGINVAALVSISEEVRSRCHLKHHLFQCFIAESQSPDGLGSELVSCSLLHHSPSFPTIPFLSSGPSISGSGGPSSVPFRSVSIGRRQVSCELLDQASLLAARQARSAPVTVNQVGCH